MGGGLESCCVGRVFGAEGAVPWCRTARRTQEFCSGGDVQ